MKRLGIFALIVFFVGAYFTGHRESPVVIASAVPPPGTTVITSPQPVAAQPAPAVPPTSAELAKSKADAKKQALQARKDFAVATEELFLKNGQSVTVTADGHDSDHMRIKYALVSKAMAYQVQHQEQFIAKARELGFVQIVLDDGFNEQWQLKL